MKRLRLSIIALTLLAGVAAPSPTASGQEGSSSTPATDVHVDAPIVTITVKIDMAFKDPNAEGIQESVASIANSIMDYWNTAFEKFNNQCVFFNLVVEINPVAESAVKEIDLENGRKTIVTTPGRHTVLWYGSDPNAPWPETYDPYDEDLIATPGDDFTSPFDHDLWAAWSGHLQTPRDFAHEFGHLLGLGDDYDENGNPLPGREGTLMDNGDEIDQMLIDRLMDVVTESGEQLPECWEGTFTYDFTGPSACSADYSVTLSVVDGEVSGAVTLENSSCPGVSPGGSITGTKTDSAFSLKDPFFDAGDFEVPITGGDRARATFSSTPLEVRVFDLSCEAC